MPEYRGHQIVRDGSRRNSDLRYKTFAPKRQSLAGGFLYTGSFNSLARARSWVDEQEAAWEALRRPDASNQEDKP